MHTEIVAQTLARHPYFRDLDEPALRQLVGQATLRQLARDEILALEGEPCLAIYIIAQGHVRALLSSEQGREQVVQALEVGEAFYTVPALDGGPLPATTQAATRATLVAFTRQAFLDYLRTHPSAAMAVLADMAGRLRQMSSLIGDLSLRTVAERLARLLVERAHDQAGQRVTQREMAARLGTVREVVARTLADFERKGWVRLGRGKIEICDEPALRQAAKL